jgi:hypothetical protein
LVTWDLLYAATNLLPFQGIGAPNASAVLLLPLLLLPLLLLRTVRLQTGEAGYMCHATGT